MPLVLDVEERDWWETTVVEYMVGPVDGKLHRCIRCQETIVTGEIWQRIWSPDGVYAIGVHVGCLPEVQAG